MHELFTDLICSFNILRQLGGNAETTIRQHLLSINKNFNQRNEINNNILKELKLKHILDLLIILEEHLMDSLV